MRNGVRKCLRKWKLKQPNFHYSYRFDSFILLRFPTGLPTWAASQRAKVSCVNCFCAVPSVAVSYTNSLSISLPSLSLTLPLLPSYSADELQSRKLLLSQQFFTRFVLKPRATWKSKTLTRNRSRCIFEHSLHDCRSLDWHNSGSGLTRNVWQGTWNTMWNTLGLKLHNVLLSMKGWMWPGALTRRSHGPHIVWFMSSEQRFY